MSTTAKNGNSGLNLLKRNRSWDIESSAVPPLSVLAMITSLWLYRRTNINKGMPRGNTRTISVAHTIVKLCAIESAGIDKSAIMYSTGPSSPLSNATVVNDEHTAVRERVVSGWCVCSGGGLARVCTGSWDLQHFASHSSPIALVVGSVQYMKTRWYSRMVVLKTDMLRASPMNTMSVTQRGTPVAINSWVSNDHESLQHSI